MNIDVREYLRINPISVHDLTLSGDAKDCFLFFPHRIGEENTEGYKAEGYNVYTQEQVFNSIINSIFRDLVEKDGDNGFRLRFTEPIGTPAEWSTTIQLQDDVQFTAWVRRKTWDIDKTRLNNLIKKLEDDLDNKILELRRTGRLNYAGAVELQSVEMKKFADLFEDFKYAIGQIWCYRKGNYLDDGATGKNNDYVYGSDEIEIGGPVKHNHNVTRAESMSSSFSSNKNGGKLIGEYYVGQKELVAYDKTYALSKGTNMVMTTQDVQSGNLTYPLWGENVIDWRTPNKSHNNVPPCVNIRVRYAETDIANPLAKGMLSRDAIATPVEEGSDVEAKYESLQVADLEEYTEEDLTDHDYILRMTLDGNEEGGVKIMKQSMRMLLDLFTEDCNADLSEVGSDGTVYSMEEILKPILDRELVTKSEFVAWYNECMERLSEIGRKLQILKNLLASMKPIVYVGKIIISTTDNTEDKVIQHYGGVRWRRMLNFLRGVHEEEDDNRLRLGNKWGESYVCLRESNVPIHTHMVTLDNGHDTGMYRDDKSSAEYWMEKQKGGSDTRMVNEANSSGKNGLGNALVEYEISPLEYRKDGSSQTMPHSNMPPYREVYIWECLETTDEEKRISGEPWEIVYDMGEAKDGKLPENAPRSYRTDWITPDLPKNLVAATSSHYTFVNYTDDSDNHTEDDNRAKITDLGAAPGRIPDGTSGTVYLLAHWNANKYTITWNSNGGSAVAAWTNREYGKPLGTLPNPTRAGYQLIGWYTALTGGKKITSSTLVSGNTTYYARWKAKTYTITFNALGGTVRGSQEYKVTKSYGETLGTIDDAIPDSQDWGELYFDGWYDDEFEGTKINSSWTVPDHDVTYYARYNGIIRYEKVGSVQVNEATDVISNFGLENYLISTVPLDFTENFEIVINATTGTDITSNQEVFGADGNLEFGIQNGKFMWEVLSPGTSEDDLDGTCLANTEYYLRLVNQDGTFKCYYKKSGASTWTASLQGDRPYDGERMFVIGQDWESKSGHWTEHWRGTINLSKSYINVYGHKYVLKPSHKVTVTFNANGGTWTTSGTHVVTLESGSKLGSKIPASAEVTRSNYTFAGWWNSTAMDGSIEVNSYTVVTSNMTAYAHWIGDKMDVKLNLNNGSSDFPSLNAKWQDDTTVEKWIKVQTGLKYPKPSASYYPPISGGYELQRWKWTNESGAIKYIGLPLEDQTAEIYPISSTGDKGLVLYALWTAKKFSVTLNLNNGNAAYPYLDAKWSDNTTADKVVGNQTYKQKYSLGISSAPTATGYTFKNWMNGSVTPPYNFPDNNHTLSNQDVLIEDDSTFYAQWTPKDVTVYLNPNITGASPSGTQTATVKFGTVATALNKSDSSSTPRIPKKTNFTFQGYYETSTHDNNGGVDSSAIQWYDGAGQGKKTVNSVSEKTLYAKWEPVTYQITLKINLNSITWPYITLYPNMCGWNNGTGGTNDKYAYVTYTKKYPSFTSAIGSAKPTASGYDFDGWYRGNSNENGVYLPSESRPQKSGDTVFDLSTTSLTVPAPEGKNLQFWAQWKAKQFRIRLHADGYKYVSGHWTNEGWNGTYRETDVTYGQPVGNLQAPSVTRTGYNWSGYYNITYLDSGGNPSQLFSTTVYAIIVDALAAYYSKWEPKQYKILFYQAYYTSYYPISYGTTETMATYDQPMPTPISLPVMADFWFGGYYSGTPEHPTWYYNQYGASVQNWTVDASEPTTLYAWWTGKDYTVTWYLNESYYSSKTVRFPGTIGDPGTPSSYWSGDNYYSFSGWNKPSNTIISNGLAVYGSMTVTAQRFTATPTISKGAAFSSYVGSEYSTQCPAAYNYITSIYSSYYDSYAYYGYWGTYTTDGAKGLDQIIYRGARTGISGGLTVSLNITISNKVCDSGGSASVVIFFVPQSWEFGRVVNGILTSYIDLPGGHKTMHWTDPEQAPSRAFYVLTVDASTAVNTPIPVTKNISLIGMYHTEPIDIWTCIRASTSKIGYTATVTVNSVTGY